MWAIAGISFGLYMGVAVYGEWRSEHKISIAIDATTGCEYLVSKDTGIFPRINSDGAHICKDPKHEEVHNVPNR